MNRQDMTRAMRDGGCTAVTYKGRLVLGEFEGEKIAAAWPDGSGWQLVLGDDVSRGLVVGWTDVIRHPVRRGSEVAQLVRMQVRHGGSSEDAGIGFDARRAG